MEDAQACFTSSAHSNYHQLNTYWCFIGGNIYDPFCATFQFPPDLLAASSRANLTPKQVFEKLAGIVHHYRIALGGFRFGEIKVVIFYMFISCCGFGMMRFKKDGTLMTWAERVEEINREQQREREERERGKICSWCL